MMRREKAGQDFQNEQDGYFLLGNPAPEISFNPEANVFATIPNRTTPQTR
jgi:hypothetical protein